MDKLVVCQGCGRHVKEHEPQCPFCRRALVPPSGARAGIALAGVVAVGVGLSFASCSGQVAQSDAGADSGADVDGGPVAAYGPPPWDAAVPDAGADADDGGLVVAYGPPPPQDAGAD